MYGLIYHRHGLITGRAIARALAYGSGGRIAFGRSATYVARSGALDKLIRWGCAEPLSTQPRSTTCLLNTPEAIGRASNKLSTLRLLSRSGLSVPRWTESLSEAQSWGTTFLGRRTRGSQGRDIQVHRPVTVATAPSGAAPSGARVADFYTEYVPNRREYRLHVFRDEVIRVQGKYLDYPDQHTNPYVKNYGQGFRFRTPDVRLHQDRLDAAVAAVQALGLDFGAVDLLIGEDGNYYILEVNTAPAGSPLTARAYVDKFAEWLGVTPDYNQLEVLRNGNGNDTRNA